MIIEGIVGALLAALGGILGVLPDAGTLELGGFGDAIAAFRAFDAGLPVSETLAMGAMCAAIIGGIFAMRVILTIWHAIPGKFS